MGGLLSLFEIGSVVLEEKAKMRTVYDDHDNDTQRKYFKQTSYLEPSAQVIPFISGKKKSQINKKKKNLFIDSYSNFQIFSTKYYNWNVKTN